MNKVELTQIARASSTSEYNTARSPLLDLAYASREGMRGYQVSCLAQPLTLVPLPLQTATQNRV